jgi:predicted AAA+ superfamily ATPase
VDKIITSDIPYFLPHIETNYLSALRSIIDFLATAAIPTINISALYSQWEIGKHKVYDLLNVLQEAAVLNIIFNTKTPKAFSKGDKILFCDCSFYHVLGPQMGSRREAYFVSTLKSAGYTVLTSKDEEQYDFQVKNINFEVGGKNKKKKKSDIVIQENLDIKTDTRWPLWIIGSFQTTGF